MDSPWYILNKALFIQEVEKMEKEGFSLDTVRLRENCEVVFNGSLSVDDEAFLVRFIYPRAFPFERPNVYMPNKAISEQDKHRTLTDGALCLRGYQPDEWDCEDSGVDLIEDIKRWIGSSRTGQWENEHIAPDLMVFRPYRRETILVPDEFKTAKTSAHGTGQIKFDSTAQVGCLDRINGVDSSVESSSVPELFKNFISISASFFYIPETPISLFEIFKEGIILFDKFLSELKKYMKFNGDIVEIGRMINPRFQSRQERRHPSNESFFLGIVFPLSDLQKWQFFLVTTGVNWTICPINTNYLSDLWNRTRGIINLEILNKASVAVLGLGSVGSTVAMELATSGVGKITLIDNDFLTIGNICRHEGFLQYLGMPKVAVLESLLKNKLPNISTVPKHFNLLHDREELKNLISQVDVVVSCIGNHNINLFINSLCLELSKPSIYAFVGPDGVAGRVIRVIPNSTGCYFCTQKYIETHPEKYFTLPEIKDINALPIDYGCNTPAIPGTGFDIKTIALAQTRLVVQTLLRNKGSYPDDQKNVFLITNRVIPEIPESNFLWSRAWDIPKLPWCKYCCPSKENLNKVQQEKILDLLD